jgi:hypothetical protein
MPVSVPVFGRVALERDAAYFPTCPRFSPMMSVAMTFAPASTSTSAGPSLRPLPVTIATLPSSLMLSVMICSLYDCSFDLAYVVIPQYTKSSGVIKIDDPHPF